MTEEIVNGNLAQPQAELQNKTENEATTPEAEESQVLIPVKFNKEIKELTQSEAATLAQKGMKYDLIAEDYSCLKEISAQHGKSVTQFLEELKTESQAKRREALTEKCGGDQELAEHILKLEAEKNNNGDMGFAELKKNFPEYNSAEDLPDEVLKAAELKGTLLLDELLRYRLAEKKRSDEAIKNQKFSENVSVGSQLNQRGRENPETAEFLRGLWK